MSLKNLETVPGGEANKATNDASSSLNCQKDEFVPKVTTQELDDSEDGNEDVKDATI